MGDQTYTYTYDGFGNILTANGHTYTYGNTAWKDLLTAFDGETITYDAMGNPLSYYNGSRYTFTWENGRSLATAARGNTSISYAYDADGLRTSKKVNNTTTYYYYAGGQLLRQVKSGNPTDFFYDANGYPYAMKRNGATYYYITNLQGDVMKMVDAEGNVVASYEYDPYGKVISATGTMASANPLRYRGYYYDDELGMYYLQSRYYDPNTGRFINADDISVLGEHENALSYNLFTYCFNNPVNHSDSSGYGPVGVGLGCLLGFGLGSLLVPWVADLLNLRGWGRKIFVGVGVAAITALGGYAGHYIGEAILAVYKAGGAFAGKINQAIANAISKIVGGTLKSARGNGWIINVGKIVVRVMTSSNFRNNYFKISIAGKMAYDISGNVSTDPAKIHIPITIDSIIKLIELIRKLTKG